MSEEAKAPETPMESTPAKPKLRPGLLGMGLVLSVLVLGSMALSLRSAPAPVASTTPEHTGVSVLQGNAAEKYWADTIAQQLKEQNALLGRLQHDMGVLQSPSLLLDTDTQTTGTGKQGETTAQASAGQLAPAAEESASLSSSGIDITTVDLQPLSPKPSKNADSFVPAGSFVQAVMLGAADVSAGVMSPANPTPLLFRITADGDLPHRAHSHLKDCVATAAVIGDISSERGQVRLERLSCIFPNGEIVEQPVEGTVFALDAKNGVRGRPVWREGALLSRATFAGALSGLAGSLTSLTQVMAAPSKVSPTAGLADNLLKTTGAQGASSALEKLAQYHIQRAEQYHPVIQLSAGQTVDLVFLKGFYLDGGQHEGVKPPSEPELFADSDASSAEDATGLTLSPQQIEKIKHHEAALGWEAGQS